MYDLTKEDKKEIEQNILRFKKEKLEEFIQTAVLLGDLANNMKNNKEEITDKIDKISPIWIRLMSEEVDNLLFSMRELVYQINNYENTFESKKNISVENNQIDKYRRIIAKKEKTKRIIKPLLPLLKNIEKV